MDRSQEHPSTGTSGQVFTKFGTAFYGYHAIIANECLGLAELVGQLCIQVGTVGYQDDGRTGKLTAPHQHSGEEKHRITLATSGSTEISTTLTVSMLIQFGVQTDIFIKLVGSEELRITAYNLHFLFG